MDDACGRRDEPEVGKRSAAPAQEFVPFAVPLKFPSLIQTQRFRRSKHIHLDRMVNDEVTRDHRVDLLRIPPFAAQTGPEGRQIHQGRDPGKILQHHPGRFEWNLLSGARLGIPQSQAPDVPLRYLGPVEISQERFQKDFDGKRELVDLSDPLLLQSSQAGIPKRSQRGAEMIECVEGILERHLQMQQVRWC